MTTTNNWYINEVETDDEQFGFTRVTGEVLINYQSRVWALFDKNIRMVAKAMPSAISPYNIVKALQWAEDFILHRNKKETDAVPIGQDW